MLGLGDGQGLVLAVAVFGAVVAASAAVMAYCAYRAMQAAARAEERSAKFFNEWQPLAVESRDLVRRLSKQSDELLTRLNKMTTTAERQLVQVDSSLTKLTELAERNAASVDATIKATLERFSESAESFHEALRVPAKQFRAVMAGLSAAMGNFAGSRQRDPARISAEEEMFL